MKTLIRYLAVLLLAVPLFAQSTPTVQVDTWAALKAITIPAVPGKLTALVKGRVSTNDGGGGTFTFTAGTGATDDGGTIATPNVGIGAWFREYDQSLGINGKWFGATGSPTGDDSVAVAKAIAFEVANPGKVIFWPAGTYRFSTNLVVTVGNFGMRGDISGGSILQYIGTATVDAAVKLQGVAPGGLYNCSLSSLTIVGNSHSASALKLNAVHHGSFKNLRLRDSITSGGYFDFCVADSFETISTSTSEGAFTTMPANGIILTNAVNACDFNNTIIEGLSSGYGIKMDGSCTANIFHAGTSEFNLGGIWVTNSCSINQFIGLYLENNTSQDLVFDSTSADNVASGLTAATTVTAAGARNLFIGGTYNSIVVTAAAIGTKFYGVCYGNNLGTFTDSGTGTIWKDRFAYPTLTYDRDKLCNVLGVNVLSSSTTPGVYVQTGNTAAEILLQSGLTSASGWKLVEDEAVTGDLALYARNGSVDSQVLGFKRSNQKLTINSSLVKINGADYAFPGAIGAAGTALTDVAGNGTLSWTAVGAGTVTGTGTANTLPIWTSASALGNSHWLGSATYLTPDGDATIAAGSTTNRIAGLFVRPLNASSNTMSLYDSSGTIASVFGPAGGLTLGGQVPPGAGNLSLALNASTIKMGLNSDVVLNWDAANTLALRNGVNAQAFEVYNTYTDGSNYERGDFKYVSNQLRIGTTKTGTGAARTMIIGNNPSGTPDSNLIIQGSPIQLYASGAVAWTINSTELFPADATSQLGDATHRVKYGFFGGSTETTSNPIITENQTFNSGGVTFTAHLMNLTDTASASGSLFQDWQVGGVSKASLRKDGTLFCAGLSSSGAISGTSGTFTSAINGAGASGIGFTSRSYLYSASDGVICLQNNAATDFTRLQFGGTTTSFPALGRSTIYLTQTLADGTAGGGFQMTGLMNKYNNISTVSGGVPAEYATVDLTAQTAAISATALYTPTASGMFRISFIIHVTTAGSTSSILGGTTGIVLTYTEPDGSVAQTFTLATDDQTGAVVVPANGNVTNTTQATCQGTAIIYAKTGIAINYAIGYTSAGTAMQYSVHGKCEAL